MDETMNADSRKPEAAKRAGPQSDPSTKDEATASKVAKEDRYLQSGKERVVAKTVWPSVTGLDSVDDNLDWVLTNYDRFNSEPQSLEEELNRLQALRSYLILDSERESQFERLTGLASRLMQVPIALVSLVDLGRQWFMSNRGLGDVRETPRSQAFCSHAIVSNDDFLIIKDATDDPRFVNNPLVTGPPFIRFYAGAPLQSPEGYKLGTFCVIDTKPWPDGLDLDSKQNLRELAALAVEVLVSRRRKRERDTVQNSQLVACTAHDLLTPLSGIELSLHLLKEDDDFQRRLTKMHKDRMIKIETCSDIVQDICKSVRSTYAASRSSFEESLKTTRPDRVNIDGLVHKLHTVIEQIKKQVPVEILVEESVPKEIISDPSKIFRCAMNYLAVACKRTKTGFVALRVFIRREDSEGGSQKSLFFVTCEDTAPAVPLDIYEHLFKPVSDGVKPFIGSDYAEDDNEICPELSLFSVACEMNVIGGEYGFRPRNDEDRGIDGFDNERYKGAGSLFWFCLPCTEIVATTSEKHDEQKKGSPKPTISLKDASNFHVAVSGMLGGAAGIAAPDGFAKRQKRALVIEDSTVVRKMLTKILTKFGFIVSQAENGMQGLEKLKNNLFDIALCDFLMPIMDGLDCVQQYRDWEKYHRPWIAQRIVGISAHASQGDIQKGRKVGMDDYRPKPITFKMLSELLQSKKQIDMSNRLDEIESREAFVRNVDKDVDSARNERGKRAKEKKSVDDRACTCLVMLLKADDEYVNFIHDALKNLGWHSTTASTETEATHLLKMRTWDLVLVDEAFVSLICNFREWETKKRQNCQERIILLAETVDETMGTHLQPPDGVNAITAKPMCLTALNKLLQRILFHLSNEAAVKASAAEERKS